MEALIAPSGNTRKAFWTAAGLRRFFDRPPKNGLHKTPVERQFADHARTKNAMASLPDTSIGRARRLFCDVLNV
jgi:hypothetical protein